MHNEFNTMQQIPIVVIKYLFSSFFEIPSSVKFIEKPSPIRFITINTINFSDNINSSIFVIQFNYLKSTSKLHPLHLGYFQYTLSMS